LGYDPINGGPMLSVAFSGIWSVDPANNVSQGFINSGIITYNIPDPKNVCMVKVRQETGSAGSVTFKMQTDNGGYDNLTPVAPNDYTTTTPTLVSPIVTGEEFYLQTILNNGSGVNGPVVSRTMLLGMPAVVSGNTISGVLNLYKDVENDGVDRTYDIIQEWIYLEGLRLSQTPVTCTIGDPNRSLYSAVCVVTELDLLPFKMDDEGYGLLGNVVCYLKSLVG
jgi:hypothetical protein